jgi:hypothetical protein
MRQSIDTDTEASFASSADRHAAFRGLNQCWLRVKQDKTFYSLNYLFMKYYPIFEQKKL